MSVEPVRSPEFRAGVAHAAYYDEPGGWAMALSSFVSDMGKHPGTERVVTSDLMPLLVFEAQQGRGSFRHFVEGFAVPCGDQP